MGRDKALVEVGGRALAVRAADAARAAGCDRVLAVGGDGPALAALGLDAVPDRWPGEGPLGGLATALAEAGEERLLLVPCDLVSPDPAALALLLAALDGATAAHPVVGGRAQWLPSAWRAAPSLAAAAAALVQGGARRLDAAADLVTAVAVPLAPAAVADADRPEDLPA